MKKLLLLALLSAVPAFALDCESPVVDNAHIFGNPVQILDSLKQLVNLGADPRVISDDPASLTPEGYVSGMQSLCPSWHAAGGGVKNNLIVFLVFPQHHKIGVFTGQEYHLDTGDLRASYMAPSFRDKEFSLGMVKAIRQTAIQIKAHQEQLLHPPVVTQQAIDMHGLWTVMDWIVGLCGLGAGIWLIFYLYRRKQATKDAQQGAVAYRNEAASRMSAVRSWLETKEALKVDVSLGRQIYDAAAEDFARVSGSETYNPDTKGLNAGQYDKIAMRYKNLSTELGRVASIDQRPAGNAPSRNTQPRNSYYKSGSTHSNKNSSSPTQVVRNTTIINEPGYYPTPVIIPIIEDSNQPSFAYEPPPTYTPDPPSSWSDSSSSSDFGSSDNSFSDSSSSFGDSGSSFDGGSSDF